jgi:hypothetical protein
MILLGTLQVQQLLVGENSKLTASAQTPFKIEGDQGDAWRKGVLALQATSQSFRVRALEHTFALKF